MYHEDDEFHLQPVVMKLKEIGFYCMNNNSFDQALECFIKAKDVTKKLKSSNDNEVANLQFELSGIYSKKGDNKNALICLLDTLQIKESLPNDEKSIDISDILCDIGIIEKDEGKYESALCRFMKALSTRETAQGFDMKIAKVLHNIGELYVK